MMEYNAKPNDMVEALVYLGARANGYTAARLEQHLLTKGVEDLSVFRRRYAPFHAILQQIDEKVALPQEQIDRLFTDLPGLPYNTTGAFSPAFLLFSPVVCRYDGDLDQVLHEMYDMSPDRIAQYLMISLDLTEGLEPEVNGCTSVFMNKVLAMAVPAETRLALLEIHRDAAILTKEIGECLRQVLTALEEQRADLTCLAEAFGRELAEIGCETYIRDISSQQTAENTHYYLRPLLLGADTNISLDHPTDDSGVVIYCGVLRRFLRQLLTTMEGTATQVYEAFRLLGDRTRFDILRYLRNHPAYGQELADHFGLARNTIHHHMSKLVNAGLVTYTVDGNRVYYAVDKERFQKLLVQQKCLIIGELDENEKTSGKKSRKL